MRKYSFLIILILALGVDAFGFRLSRPRTYTLPWTQDQVSSLNNDLESIWNLTNGRYTLDIVTTTKTNASNGEIWLIRSGLTTRIQYKDGRVFTVSPDF